MAWIAQRGKVWRAVVRTPDGRINSTHDTRAEAEAWAARQEHKKAVGTTHGGATVGELFEAYYDAVASKRDSAKWDKLRLDKWCLDRIAERPLADVSTRDINEWIARRSEDMHRGKRVTCATINRELNLMSGAFEYARKDREWIKVNPCHGARRPDKGKARKPKLLTPEQIEAVCISTGYAHDQQLQTLTARVGACFLLALETGMRSGEILRMRPADYWRNQNTLHVAAIERGGRKSSKSGQLSDPGRDVPLTARVIELLDQLIASMPAGQPYIVGASDSQRDSLWRKARDQAGLIGHTFHDSKHEACTRLASHIDVLALSHAIGTKDVQLLRDLYYCNDTPHTAALLPRELTPTSRPRSAR